jgi:hypothetical protein
MGIINYNLGTIVFCGKIISKQKLQKLFYISYDKHTINNSYLIKTKH